GAGAGERVVHARQELDGRRAADVDDGLSQRHRAQVDAGPADGVLPEGDRARRRGLGAGPGDLGRQLIRHAGRDRRELRGERQGGRLLGDGDRLGRGTAGRVRPVAGEPGNDVVRRVLEIDRDVEGGDTAAVDGGRPDDLPIRREADVPGGDRGGRRGVG